MYVPDELAERARAAGLIGRTFAPREEVLAAFRTAPVLDAQRFWSDIDSITDQDLFGREW